MSAENRERDPGMIRFTKEELDWLVQEPGHWHIREDCPEDVREVLTEKFHRLYLDLGECEYQNIPDRS